MKHFTVQLRVSENRLADFITLIQGSTAELVKLSVETESDPVPEVSHRKATSRREAPNVRRRWSESEDQVILEAMEMCSDEDEYVRYMPELARELGRTEAAVSSRSWKLKNRAKKEEN